MKSDVLLEIINRWVKNYSKFVETFNDYLRILIDASTYFSANASTVRKRNTGAIFQSLTIFVLGFSD